MYWKRTKKSLDSNTYTVITIAFYYYSKINSALTMCQEDHLINLYFTYKEDFSGFPG